MITKIEVLDAIMGSGKTHGIIKWMLSNPSNKYLYISPMLTEVEQRTPDACEALEFTFPTTEDHKTKSLHLLELLREGHEYRLHYIHYSGKDGGYELTQELNESKNSKYSAHNKVKRLNILSVLWDEVMESFTGRVGRGIKERYDLYLQGLDVDGE